MLTRLLRKRGTGQGPVVESTPQHDPWNFGGAKYTAPDYIGKIDADKRAAKDKKFRGRERDRQIVNESPEQMRYKTPTELGR